MQLLTNSPTIAPRRPKRAPTSLARPAAKSNIGITSIETRRVVHDR